MLVSHDRRRYRTGPAQFWPRPRPRHWPGAVSGPPQGECRLPGWTRGARGSWLLAWLLAVLAPSRPPLAGGLPENAAVIVNADSWASMSVANEYTRARRIPASHVVYLAGLSSFDSLPVDEFREQILRPVLSTLDERQLAGQIDYVLYSADFPTAINVRADVGSRRLPRIITPDAAINGLTFLYLFVLQKDSRYLDLNCNLYARRPERGGQDTIWNDAEQQRYGDAIEQMVGAISARRQRQKDAAKAGASDAAAAQPQAAAGDELQRLRAAVGAMVALAEAHPHAPELLYNIACVQAQLGEPDQALAWLQKATKNGWFDLQHAQHDEDLEPIRGRPEFKTLAEEMQTVDFAMPPPISFRGCLGWSPAGAAVGPDKGLRYLISTVLACTSGRGLSVSEAVAGLRRSVAADFSRPSGTVYLMRNGDVRSTTREWAFRRAVAELARLRVSAVVEQGVLPKGHNDVAGAMVGAADFDWAKSGSAILPGAVCEHLTSFGGALGQAAGQTCLTEFLRAGAAGASGTVTEPYALQAKFPNAFMHVAYASGCTLGEAFYQAVTGPYQLLVVGDALCQPWARKLDVMTAGLRPQQVLKAKVEFTPHLRGADDAWRTVGRFELYVDGRRAAVGRPGQSLQLDTVQLADGPHELQVVARTSTPLESAGRLVVPVVVRNGRATLCVTGPARTEVRWDLPLQLRLRLQGASAIAIHHNGRVLAQLTGEEGTVTIDPSVLGPGPVRLQPIGRLPGPGRKQVWGTPLDLIIVPPPALPSVELPAGATPAPGLALEVSGRPPVVVDQTKGDWLVQAGVNAGTGFSLEAVVQVPATEVYQFQLGGNVTGLSLCVDGVAQNWPRGRHWWFVPVHLATGWHCVRIEGTGAEAKPQLDIRFGGRGTQWLDKARFFRPTTTATRPG